MEILVESGLFRLTLDAARSHLRWTRTAVPYADIPQAEEVLRHTVFALLRVERSRHTLLVDLREGPMRNDDAFEAVALRFRREVHQGFAKSAVLVRSRAGLLQINRHGKERPELPSHPTFLDESDAHAYLGLVG